MTPSRDSRGRSSSLDALSRTIDGLEARIEGLMVRQGGTSGDHTEHRTARAPGDKAIAEREGAARTAGAAGPDDSDSAMREIAEKLLGLRGDLKRDFSDSLSRELSGLRDELADLSERASQPLSNALRGELGRLAGAIERLGAQPSDPSDTALAEEVAGLRETVGAVARETERGWSVLDERLSKLDDGSLREEVGALAGRLEEIKVSIAGLGESPEAEETETQLKAVASALETLAEQVNLDEASIDHRFSELGERLDEISRAVIAVGDSGNSEETLSRIESRMEGLSAQLEGTGDGEAIERLADRLSGLSEKLDGVASEGSVRALGDRVESLSGLIGDAGDPENATGLAARLAEISTRIEGLDHGTLDEALAGRLDDLAERIDALGTANQAGQDGLVSRIEAVMERAQSRGEASVGAPDLSGLEQRLDDIARRLDESQSAPHDAGAMDRLEEQLVGLSQMMAKGPSMGETHLEPRISAIEEHLETNDDYIVEAARQAAEAVIEAYAQRPVGSSQDREGEIAAMSELARDLRTLENLGRHSEKRTAQAFEAVHDTLIKIAEHLQALNDTRHGGKPSVPPVTPLSVPGEEADAYAGEHAAQAETPVARGDVDAREEGAAAAAGFAGLDVMALDDDRDDPFTGGDEMPAARAHDDAKTRNALAETPALDPADAFDRENEDERDDLDAAVLNEPLEPGSGQPDIRGLLRQSRRSDDERSAAGGDSAAGANESQTDFIAAARRAAQAAVSEADTTKGAKEKTGSGFTGTAKRHRRPILLGAGAVLLALLAWPLANDFFEQPDQPVAAIGAQDAGTPGVSNEQTASTTSRASDAEADLDTVPSIDGGGKSPAAKPDDATGASTAPAADAKAPLVKDAEPADQAVDGDAAASAPNDTQADTPSKPQRAARDLPAPPFGTNAGSPTKGETADGEPASQVLTPQRMLADGALSLGSAQAVKDASRLSAADAANGDDGDPVATAQTSNAKDTGSEAGKQTADAGSTSPVPAVPEAIGPAALRKAAEKGDPKALFEIGARYTEGRGVDTDLGEAAKWYEAAATRGFAPAEYRLANFYEKGSGVDRNVDTAKNWYTKAAKAGNISAMHNLAVLYAMGEDGKPSYDNAVRWFQDAAEHGVKDSQFNLAILYAQGNGVPRDLTQSYKWFAIAARGGDKDATDKKEQVAAALDKSDLAKARQAATDWQAEPIDAKANGADMPAAWSGKEVTTGSVDMKKAVRNIQAILNNNGYDAGPTDGMMGEHTRSAIRAFQKSIGAEPTGKITDGLIRKLIALNAKHGPKASGTAG
ncbi:peptidoglycan-binding protein [Pararhizobium mangrovi]|nr:peptidoglycan-binding protein [Pararhizobium mangrovi]